MDPTEYYVYELIDPRDMSVFYVGKGTGNRISQHVKDAKKNKTGKKYDLIRDILSDGLSVIEKKIKHFDAEDDAYKYEAKRIEHIGLENLTNIAPGGRSITSEQYYQRKQARDAILSISKIIRRYVKHDSFLFKWCGTSVTIEKERLLRMILAGINQATDILGKTACESEFMKYNIVIENNLKQCHS